MSIQENREQKKGGVMPYQENMHTDNLNHDSPTFSHHIVLQAWVRTCKYLHCSCPRS